MIKVILAAVIWIGSITFGYAEFFTNVGETSDAEEASASTFEAVANIYLGLSNLERQGPDGSVESFNTALEKLSQAMDQFKSLSESGDFTQDLDLSQIADQARMPEYLDHYQMPRPEKAGDLFGATSAVLSRVYEAIKIFLDKRGLAEYRSMQTEISWALGFGELASEIARQNNL